MKSLHIIAFILLIIGGLNWGLVALGWNIVDMIFGSWPWLVSLIYILVGLAAVYELVTHKKSCKSCKVNSAEHSAM